MFDLEQLKQRAGAQRFLEGKKLAEQGRVSRIAISGNRVTGIVSGQDDYHVCLSQTPDIQGSDSKEDEYDIINGCSCPAAEYQDVCKHSVALAIAASQHTEPLPDIDVQTQALRQHLLALPNEQLVDIMLASIISQPSEWDKWQLMLALAAKVQGGQDQTGHYDAMHQGKDSLHELTHLLIHALPQASCWEWREVRTYFNHADEEFELLMAASEQLTVDQQWDFCIAALERLNLVLEQIHDSGDHRFTIEGQLNETLGRLFEHLSWPDETKAQWLLDHMAQRRFDVFPTVPDDFSFTEAVHSVFLVKCRQRVQQVLELPESQRQSFELDQLIFPLIKQAKEQGDWQEQCRLQALIAKNYRDYLQISQICLDNDEALDAEPWLLQAKQCSYSAYEQRACALHEVKVCVALGEHTVAWKKAWQLFCQQPSFADYCQLEQLHFTLGEPDKDFLAAVERVLAEHGEIPQKLSWQNKDDILAFYLHQQQVDKARAWAQSHQASEKHLLSLAKLTLLVHPEESMLLLHRVLQKLIEQTNNSAYEQALNVLLEIANLITTAEKPKPAEQAFNKMLLALAQEFKPKRNMLKLLRQHFPQCIG